MNPRVLAYLKQKYPDRDFGNPHDGQVQDLTEKDQMAQMVGAGGEILGAFNQMKSPSAAYYNRMQDLGKKPDMVERPRPLNWDSVKNMYREKLKSAQSASNEYDQGAIKVHEMEQADDNRAFDRQMKERELDDREEARKQSSADRNAALGIQRQQLEVSRGNLDNSTRKADAEIGKIKHEIANPQSKMTDTGKKDLSNISMAKQAIAGMKNALSGGDNTFSMVGDNDYTRNRKYFVEAFGRLQSGGVISADEVSNFQAMMPKITDSAEQQQKKLDDMMRFLDARASLSSNPRQATDRPAWAK